MSKHTVIHAARETFFGQCGAPVSPGRLRLHPVEGGAGGVGVVLKALHAPSLNESLPSQLESLLARLDDSERDGR